MSNPSIIKINDTEYVRRDAIEPVGDTNGTPFVVGKAYVVRTVTMIVCGKCIGVVGQFLVLDEAAWIADTGRFSDFLAKGIVNEVEPTDGRVFIGLGSIVDVYGWKHATKWVQK